MKEIRLGITGIGNMGVAHGKRVLEGQIKGCRLTAISDFNKERANRSFPEISYYEKPEEMIASGEIDALLIATPHFAHTPIGIAALNGGIHTLVEKPISVHKADCERLLAAHRDKKIVFGAMFNLRMEPVNQQIKHLIESGELGEIFRINWTITNWFRTQAYYDSGNWRATWKGEGGGVLLNQCPHQLDLWQWWFGMPDKVHAFCAFGRHHDIEVEDDVTAYMHYDNGCTGVFITSTGEAPGTNRLEVIADRGKLIVEDGKITFVRNTVPTREHIRCEKGFSAQPATQTSQIAVPKGFLGFGHRETIQNFIDAIRNGCPLTAPGEEGIYSVELANSMLLSTLENRAIDLPMDSKAYEAVLNRMIEENSTAEQSTAPVAQ